jgi:hypothetical protein
MNDGIGPAPIHPTPDTAAAPGHEQDYDVYSWAMSLGVTPAELRAAIADVGHGAAAVRRRLAAD